MVRTTGSHGDLGDTVSRALPLARKDDLIVTQLDEEVLVYDQRRHRAHSLNAMMAAVWRACDGQTSVEDLAARLNGEATPVTVEAIWLALGQLSKAHLLQERVAVPAGNQSRRALMKKIGVGVAGGAVVLPVLATIAAQPAAAQVTTPGGNTPTPTNTTVANTPTPTNTMVANTPTPTRTPTATATPVCIPQGQSCVQGGTPCCAGLNCGGAPSSRTCR